MIRDKIYKLIKPHQQNNVLARIVDWFFNYKSTQIINTKSDQELKGILEEGFDELLPIFMDKLQARGIKEGEKLGSPKIPRTAEIKKLMELEIDEL